jgi:hypothetical protein
VLPSGRHQEGRIRGADHRLRAIRRATDIALAALSRQFAALSSAL